MWANQNRDSHDHRCVRFVGLRSSQAEWCIANIVNGRPPKDTFWKSTLIVATTSLVFQCNHTRRSTMQTLIEIGMQELEKHGHRLYVGSVTRYTAAFDTLSPDPVAKLREFDIM